MEKREAEAAAVAEIVHRHIAASVLAAAPPEAGQVQYIVLPDGLAMHSLKPILDEYSTHPDRKSGISVHETLTSFIEHVNAFKHPESDGQSVLFGNVDRAELLCLYNYDEQGKGKPGFGDFRAVYICPVSDEWQAWTAVAGKAMDQATFCEFIEDHVHDVINPEQAGPNATHLASILESNLASPAKLMTLARGLAVNIGKRVQNATNLSTGEVQIAFSEEHNDAVGRPLKVPGAFAIGIPVLRGGRLWQLPIRLRYRVGNGSVNWILQPHRVEETKQAVFDEVCAEAREKTELPLFFGRPE